MLLQPFTRDWLEFNTLTFRALWVNSPTLRVCFLVLRISSFCGPRRCAHTRTQTHTHTYTVNDEAPVSWVPCRIQHWARTNQINPGLTSVDRNATTTLAPYNAWFQLSHLRTTYHLHTFQFKVPAGHLAARCVHMEYGIGLVLLIWMQKWWSSLLGKHGFRLRGIQSYSNRW